ncbi:response regulator [Fibrella sp. WM1]|uniref:response regulator n=1 Tax=Fibrella musci TaxID=3242485 RepID=UPI0035221ED6
MIYVVDDAADYLFLVQQVFKLFLPQYAVRFFADGLDLMQHIDQTDDPILPSVIVLDVDMPKLDGLQTLERLKQLPGWKVVPVVMISNRTDEQFVVACYKRGASSCLVKPLNINELRRNMELLGQYWVDLNRLPTNVIQ